MKKLIITQKNLCLTLTNLFIFVSCGQNNSVKNTKNHPDLQAQDGGATGGFVPRAPNLTIEPLSCSSSGGNTDFMHGVSDINYTAAGFYFSGLVCRDPTNVISYIDARGGTIPCAVLTDLNCNDLSTPSGIGFQYNGNGGAITANQRFLIFTVATFSCNGVSPNIYTVTCHQWVSSMPTSGLFTDNSFTVTITVTP